MPRKRAIAVDLAADKLEKQWVRHHGPECKSWRVGMRHQKLLVSLILPAVSAYEVNLTIGAEAQNAEPDPANRRRPPVRS
jgi:hypothetical protein